MTITHNAALLTWIQKIFSFLALQDDQKKEAEELKKQAKEKEDALKAKHAEQARIQKEAEEKIKKADENFNKEHSG